MGVLSVFKILILTTSLSSSEKWIPLAARSELLSDEEMEDVERLGRIRQIIVSFEGGISQDRELRKLLKQFIGSPYKKRTVREIQETILNYYKQFHNSIVAVVVPDQEAKEGILQLSVIFPESEQKLTSHRSFRTVRKKALDETYLLQAPFSKRNKKTEAFTAVREDGSSEKQPIEEEIELASAELQAEAEPVSEEAVQPSLKEEAYASLEPETEEEIPLEEVAVEEETYAATETEPAPFSQKTSRFEFISPVLEGVFFEDAPLAFELPPEPPQSEEKTQETLQKKLYAIATAAASEGNLFEELDEQAAEPLIEEEQSYLTQFPELEEPPLEEESPLAEESAIDELPAEEEIAAEESPLEEFAPEEEIAVEEPSADELPAEEEIAAEESPLEEFASEEEISVEEPAADELPAEEEIAAEESPLEELAPEEEIAVEEPAAEESPLEEFA
ncbi:MAG: hypothetical protein KGJ02_05985, partial [Verrucomicrobiota bacterium]|nr:hypothetical protein [Verrucomicrobiota bacterium]